MAKIRDYAVTIYAATTASMVCEMPEHQSGDLLVAFVNKDTASNFNTPAGWTAQQTQTSAGAAGGVYTKRATSSSETVTFTLTLETCCAVVIAVQNVNGTTEADAISTSAKSGADDSTLPLSGSGITPSHNNCLILHGLSTDSGIGANALPPWVNLFVGDTGANSLCVSYTQQKTAAAITAPDHWGGAADDSRGFAIAIRDDGTGAYHDCYIPVTTTPATQISPLNGVTGAVDKGAWIAANSIAITSVSGKTVTGITITTTADAGINPFRATATTAGSSSTTNLAHTELDLTSTINLTSNQGLVFGTFRNTAPRDYVDTGSALQGGKYIIIGSTSANWKAWVVGGQFTKTEKPEARNVFLIEVASSDTIYASAGTANMASADYFAFGSSGYYGAASVQWNELYLINDVIIAGGGATGRISFDEFVFTVNNGCGVIPLVEQSGALGTIWCPVRFGGTDPIFILCNLNTFQFPRKADEIDYVNFHVSNNKIGVEFYGVDRGGGDVDFLHFTNCLFTSPSSYYWRFNSSHSANANINFAGSTVVNASVILRSTVTLSSVSFIDCSSFTLNSAILTNCSFSNTKVTAASLSELENITNCDFTSSGTGHAIEVSGSASSIDLVDLTFTGYSGTSTNAAIYVNIASGTVTLNISGGTTPSIRTAGATVNVVQAVTITLTGLVNPTEVRVYDSGTTTELAGSENVTTGSFQFSLQASTVVDIRIFSVGYLPADILAYTIPSSNASVPIQQVIDRVYSNL